ncbi:MAG: hypothetical protein IPL83_04025 [Bdellovibrionales bacterium]|nr:hypothetical protein [Bdellovibrionales bacterium]
MLKAKKKIHIEMTDEKLHRLIDEIESSNLTEETRQELINSLRALIELDRLVGLKSATIARLRKIFGKQSEKVQQKRPSGEKACSWEHRSSGRHGHDHYPSVSVQNYEIVNLKEKDPCPDCQKGRVYNWNPGMYVRVTDNPPLSVSVHKTRNFVVTCVAKYLRLSLSEKGGKIRRTSQSHDSHSSL